MKILVTGASGYIGGSLVRELSERGMETRAFVRHASNISRLRAMRNVEICYGDLTDFPSLGRAAEGIQVVHHIGGLANDWGDYQEFYHVNYLGTKNILQASINADVKKFIYLSSLGVLDLTGAGIVQENQPYGHFTGNYCRSKVKAEKLVRKNSGLIQTVIIRPPAVYGPEDSLCTERALKFAQKNLLFLVNKGKGIFPYVYIDNLIEALLLATQKESAIGEIFNLLDGGNTSAGEFFTYINHIAGKRNIHLELPFPLAWGMAFLMETFARLTGKPPLLSWIALKFLTLKCQFDISKAKEKLEYKPSISLNEGMRRVKLWWDSM